jgi:electron-transferring-flavoprotein dehydrogenase
VYEFVKNDQGSERFVINAQNCVYGKICDIEDPTRNIVRVTLEGRARWRQGVVRRLSA